MIFNEQVKTYRAILVKAIKHERFYINDGNSNKVIRCYNNVIKCLDSVDQNIYITVESAQGKAKRPFDIPNIGSLMECLVKIVCDKVQATEYSKEFNDDQADIKLGWCEYEIKSCMGATSLNSKVQGDRPVLLINEKGVFSIKKSEIAIYTKNGKFPYNKEVGKKWVGLSSKLGL